MKKALLTTVFTGYNYGSSLQALAGKTILNEVGYDCDLVAMKSLIKGRDVRINKLINILWRTILLSGNSSVKSIKTYQKTYQKELIGDSVYKFARFTEDYLTPQYLSWSELKKKAVECDACFAGSDQIWNSSTLYIDPLYYLRFAPREKRIALAPSFGRDFVAEYNKNKIGQWISEFASISIREDSGVGIIKELTGRDAVQLIDPTLMVSGEKWKQLLGIRDENENYILAYFLDKPSENAQNAILELKKKYGCDVIAIPYRFEDMDFCDKMVPTGPIEFINLVNNAKCVLTDSFHGTAFSINLHTPFYVFNREYGTASSQSSRVESILRKIKMERRFAPEKINEDEDSLDFGYSEAILEEERGKAKDYIKSFAK